MSVLVNFQFLGQNTQDKQLKKRRYLLGLVLRFPPTVFGSIALGLRQHRCNDRACNGRVFTQSPEEDEGWSQGSQLPRIALALKTCSKALTRESISSGEDLWLLFCQMYTLSNYLLNIYAYTRRLVSAAPTLVREFPCYSEQQSLQRFLLSQSAENKCQSGVVTCLVLLQGSGNIQKRKQQ